MERKRIYNRVLNYEKFNTNMTEFVNDNKIASPSNYLIITSIREREVLIYMKKDLICGYYYIGGAVQ